MHVILTILCNCKYALMEQWSQIAICTSMYNKNHRTYVIRLEWPYWMSRYSITITVLILALLDFCLIWRQFWHCQNIVELLRLKQGVLLLPNEQLWTERFRCQSIFVLKCRRTTCVALVCNGILAEKSLMVFRVCLRCYCKSLLCFQKAHISAAQIYH